MKLPENPFLNMPEKTLAQKHDKAMRISTFEVTQKAVLKAFVEWLESHYFGRLEKTYEETPLNSQLFTIPKKEWESFKKLAGEG